MSSPVRVVALILLLAHAAIAGAASAITPIERALRAEDHTGAERLARAQLDVAERGHDHRSMPTLLAIDALVEVLLDGERIETPDLEPLIAREEKLARELTGDGSPELARALMRKANWFSLRREYPQFTQTIHAAETVAHSIAGETPERVEIDLQSGFSLFYIERKPIDGEALIQRSYDALKKAADPDPRLLSKALRIHARMQFDAQARHKALPAMREYEAHARTMFGEHSARRSDALTWLGYTLRESGQYAEGIDALRQGEEIAARLQPYRQRLHVDALIALAQNLGIIGDTEKARETFERGLAIEERQQTANGYLMGLLLNSLGVLHGNQGEYEKASGYFAKAVPIYARVFGADSPRSMVMQKNYAETLQGLGQYDQAAAIYETIIAEHEKNPAARAGTIALLPYKNFATLRLWQHRYVEAEALYRRFLDLLGDGRDFNEINPRTGTAGLAAALWGQARHREAFEQARQAQRIAVRARRNALDQMSERQMLAFDRSQHDVAGLAVAIAADSRDPDLIGQAWQLEMEASGYVTRATATRLALAATRRTDEALWQEWRTANSNLSGARVAASKAPSEDAIAAVDRAQEQLDRIERRLAGIDSREGRALVAEQADHKAVDANLPDAAMLVRYIEISDHAADRYQRDESAANARLFALVRTRAAAPRAIDLGPLRDISLQAGAWYALSSDPRGDPATTSAAAQALRRALLDPLTSGEHPRRVFVVPSPALSRINFAALVDEQGRHLVETGPLFHLLNHERELLPVNPRPGKDDLLLAGAASVATSPIAATGLDQVMRGACPRIGTDLLPLPGAADEIASLRELALGHAMQADVLTAAAATESAVRDAMPGHSIIHLATHAFALGDHCSDGEMLRSISLEPPPADAAQANVTDLRELSALAFLPRPDDRNAYDGLLTSEEIATLNLSAADWVVLSACETALGNTTGGEGVFGLRRAFRLAGARTVVMSLWKVEDRATAEFMQALYKARLVDRLDTPAAMQAAMRATLDARRRSGESTHPLYWAGFVAAGAWR